MKKKKSQVRNLVYKEEFVRRRMIWILFLCSISLILFDKFALSLLFIEDCVLWKNLIEILYDVALSVVAATIFYVLTDFYPNTEKKIVQKMSIANSLYFFKNEVGNVRRNFCVRDIRKVFSDKKFFEYYLKDDVSAYSIDGKISSRELHTFVHFRHDRLLRLNSVISQTKATYKELLSLSVFMSEGDFCIINNVFYCELFTEIRRISCYSLDCNERNLQTNLGLFMLAYYNLKFWEKGLDGLYGRYSKYATINDSCG